MKKERILITAIIILGFFIRVLFVDKYPAGFNADEYSQGYTAYSILKTGKDEWGVKFPITPRAYGDYRSPLYTYLIIPSIYIFGLNEFSVRLPNAIYGALAILVLYFVVKELFNNDTLALISSLFLALSPWHICLSRGAFEANLTTLLLPLGIFFFLKAIKSEKTSTINFILSSIFFSLNIFSYYSPRFFTPICVLILVFVYWKDFSRKKGKSIFVLFFCAVVLGSLLMLLGGVKTRVSDTSILNPTDKWGSLSERQYDAIFLGLPSKIERFFNNKITFSVNQFWKNYLGYFSFEFLFTKGASEATYGMIPGRGVLYLFELPFIFYTLFLLLKNKDRKLLTILLILVFSPVAASLAKGERAGNRSSTMIPFLQILSAYGLVSFYELCKKKNYCRKLIFGFFLGFIVFFAFFMEDYIFHAPKLNSIGMAYGWRQLVDYLNLEGMKYQRVVISKSFSEPQIALAFFQKLDPLLVQKYAPKWLEYEKKGLLFVDMLSEYNLEKYEFRNFHFPDEDKTGKTLFVGSDKDFWGINANVQKIIYYPGPSEKVAFKAVIFEEK